jgi:hypothetical protein
MANTIIYNPDIPQRKDDLAKSQVDFLNNFSTLYNAFANNHVALDKANAGNHTIVQLLEQDKKAQFQTNIDQISIYVKKVKGQTDQIFLRYQGNQKEFQFSTYQIYSLPSTLPNQFFTFLPGNVIVYFGALEVILGTTPFSLGLTPQIAKNIITVNLCPLGPTPGSIPYVTLPTPVNNIIAFIELTLIPGSIFGGPSNLFYIVMANI